MDINSQLISLYIYLACWFFTSFEPIQDIINSLFSTREDGYLLNLLWIMLGCQKCLTLWTALIITQNIWIALSLSLLAQIHTKIIK